MSSLNTRHLEFWCASSRRRKTTGGFFGSLMACCAGWSGAEPVRLVEHDLAAGGVDGEGDMDQLRQLGPNGRLLLRRHEEHHKAAAAGAQQLAADGAGAARRLIDLVDGRVADVGGELAFEHPALVQQLA